MKKKIIIAVAAVLAAMCVAAAVIVNFDRLKYVIDGNRDSFAESRPTAFPESVWISRQGKPPYIKFTVPEDHDGSDDREMMGEIISDSGELDITVQFDEGRQMFVYTADDPKLIFSGECTFEEGMFTVSVVDWDNTVLGEKNNDTVVFYKIDEEAE